MKGQIQGQIQDLTCLKASLYLNYKGAKLRHMLLTGGKYE